MYVARGRRIRSDPSRQGFNLQGYRQNQANLHALQGGLTLEDDSDSDSDSDSVPPSLLSASSESGSDDDGADGGIWCSDDGVWYDDDSMPPLTDTDTSDDSETEPNATDSEDDNLYFTMSMAQTSDVPPDLEDVYSSGPPSLVSASDDDSETDSDEDDDPDDGFGWSTDDDPGDDDMDSGDPSGDDKNEPTGGFASNGAQHKSPPESPPSKPPDKTDGKSSHYSPEHQQLDLHMLMQLQTFENMAAARNAQLKREGKRQVKFSKQTLETTLRRQMFPKDAANRTKLIQYRGSVNDSSSQILIDSGASRDFISQEMVEKCHLTTEQMDAPLGVAMADGRTVNAGKIVKAAEIKIGPLTVKRDLCVINMKGLEVILGKPFLHDFNPNLDWINNSMELSSGGTFYSLNPNGEHRRASFGDSRITHADLAAALSKGEPCFAAYVSLQPPSETDEEQAQFMTTLDANNEECFVTIAPVLEVGEAARLDITALKKILTPVNDDETQLSQESAKKIMDFIMRHPDVATESEEPSQPRKVDGEHVFHTITENPGSRPPFKQPYRMAPSEVKELKKMLDEMLQKGFLRPSSSAYGAPVMFVPKPDGTLRMVLDYRDLNSQTVKDKYPLPRDHDLFDQLQMNEARFLSSLDLLYGYWQVLVHPDDIHKTAIRTPLGSYEYVVMPMGLTNAPATFQRMMEAVLRPFLTDFCMVYLDDIIVYSRTEEEHVKHILLILEALHKHGLKIKPKKCEFFKKRIKFLGHIVHVKITNGKGDLQIGKDPEKVKVIKEWSEPNNNTELQSFVGAVNYYSKLMENYAEDCAPLMAIMSQKWNRDNRDEFWKKEHSLAFEKLKISLSEAPVLSLPRPDRPFILQTDASNIALGGVLMQEREDGKRVVVTFFSHKFTSAERNWPVHERELFGLVFALRKFRHYLMGADVKYEGDHKPLAWIKTQKNLSQRQARWLETLESFDWTFKHVPGKDLVVPDALSRMPEPEKGCFLTYMMATAEHESIQASKEQPHLATSLATQIDSITERLASVEVSSGIANDEHEQPLTVIVPDNNTTAVGELFTSSSLINKLKHAYLEDSFADAVLKGEEKHGFVVQRGIVMRFDSDQSRFPCVYVPAEASEIQHMIMSEYHDAIVGGHLGAAKTYEKARRSFYWVNMKNGIEAFVKSCDACQRAKRRTTSPPGVNVPFAIPEMPFEVIAMDMKSGLPKTSRGNNAFWVVVDKLTRRAHIIPCNTECTSSDVARMVFDNVIRHWGVPHKIISDRDPRFIAAFWQELWKLIGTKLNMSTAEHPQTDGSSERFIGTVSGMVRARALKDGRDWDVWISALEFAYNDSVHPATGYTPFQLSIGRDPAMPITMLLNGILQRPSLYSQHDEFVDARLYLSRFTSMMTAAKQELRKKAQVQQQALLKRASYPVNYDPGDYAWMEASTLRTPLNTLAPRRHGPYRVMRKVGLNSYELDFGDKSRRHNPINEEKLSPYLDRASKLPWPSHGVLPGDPPGAAQLPLPPPVPTIDGTSIQAQVGSDASEQTALTPQRATQLPSQVVIPHQQQIDTQLARQPTTKYHNKDLIEIEAWKEVEDDDVIKAQVKSKYRGIAEPVWRDLHDVLKSGGFKKAHAFLEKQGGIQHPHLWRSGFSDFDGKPYPFISTEYQTRNTDGEAIHRPYYVVYNDKDSTNLNERELKEAESTTPDQIGSLSHTVSANRRAPRILEVCCGTKSASKAIKRLWPGAKIVTLDIDSKHAPTLLADVNHWRFRKDVFPSGYFDIIWASPPCTEYSVAKTTGVRDLTAADRIVKSVRRIIDYFQPKAWFIENPHALLHVRRIMADIDHLRTTCTYCQYGASYRKETDVWTNVAVKLKHCKLTPCAHFRAFGCHSRTAQAGPSGKSQRPGTRREEAYQVPQPLMTVLMKAALQQCGYQV